MGLDFRHDRPPGHYCPQWSYDGFADFRRRLAEEEEFDLDSMQGYGGDISWTDVITDLKPLLNHSDADGSLTAEECAQIAPRLREAVADWPDDYDHRSALNLAACMDACAAAGEKLEFC